MKTCLISNHYQKMEIGSATLLYLKVPVIRFGNEHLNVQIYSDWKKKHEVFSSIIKVIECPFQVLQ